MYFSFVFCRIKRFFNQIFGVHVKSLSNQIESWDELYPFWSSTSRHVSTFLFLFFKLDLGIFMFFVGIIHVCSCKFTYVPESRFGWWFVLFVGWLWLSEWFGYKRNKNQVKMSDLSYDWVLSEFEAAGRFLGFPESDYFFQNPTT